MCTVTRAINNDMKNNTKVNVTLKLVHFTSINYYPLLPSSPSPPHPNTRWTHTHTQTFPLRQNWFRRGEKVSKVMTKLPFEKNFILAHKDELNYLRGKSLRESSIFSLFFFLTLIYTNGSERKRDAGVDVKRGLHFTCNCFIKKEREGPNNCRSLSLSLSPFFSFSPFGRM